MNDETITRFLQEALEDNELQVEARRDGSQLLVILSSRPEDELDYETLTNWFVTAVRSLPGIQIETLKLQNAVAGKVKWYNQVDLGSTNHAAPNWQFSDYCFIRNDLLLRTSLPKPTDDVCQIILTFDQMERDQQYAILEALTAFFQSPAQIHLDPFPSESQAWFKSIQQLKEKPFKDASIWMSRYCANPEVTRKELTLAVPAPENLSGGSIYQQRSTTLTQPLASLRPGDRLNYQATSWKVTDYSTYDDPNGYETLEWTLVSQSGREYCLLQEVDPEDSESFVHWYLAEEVRSPQIREPGSSEVLTSRLWKDMQQGKTPYPALQLYNRIYQFESKTEGSYDGKKRQTSRITWDYWDEDHQWNLALEAWQNQTLAVYSTQEVSPKAFSIVPGGGATSKLDSSSKILFSILAWAMIGFGVFLMIFG